MNYLVYLQSKEDKLIDVTVCNETEFANLLQHIDSKRYVVTEAVKLADRLPIYKEFCKKEDSLETGKNK